jgi:hypothetical protein
MTVSWLRVAETLRQLAHARPESEHHLDQGQRASLEWIADRLPKGGLVLADEVGTGKTRIACAVVQAVVAAGGRAAVVVPQGLMHQWKAEARQLDPDAADPKVVTTLTEVFQKAPMDEPGWHAHTPNRAEAEWCLISHRFRAPIVKRNAIEWRVALPQYTRMYARRLYDVGDARERWAIYARDVASSMRDQALWGTRGMARIAASLADVVRKDRSLLSRIDRLPDLNAKTSDNSRLTAEFVNDGPARVLTEALLGQWLGPFDLVVIDEAHKSRGAVESDADDDQPTRTTILSHLLERILQDDRTESRRMSLTATPMELDPSQWIDLLRRTRCDADLERCRTAIDGLRSATAHAAIAPDETVRLDALCRAAREFETELAPFVIRRRRTAEATIAEFQRRLDVDRRAAHPHRRVAQVPVEWHATNETDRAWADVMFAAECASRSLRGMPRSIIETWPRSLQTVYTKIADGHVAADVLDEQALTIPDDIDPALRRKVARANHWLGELRAARKRVCESVGLDDFDPDSEHPRIRAAVREIETWSGSPVGEKVLVFGVFLKPLHQLRNVLEIRELLRRVARGQPIPRRVSETRGMLSLAVRELDRMRGSELKGDVPATTAELASRFEGLHELYETRRRSLHDRAKRAIDAALKNHGHTEWIGSGLRDHIHRDFVTFLMDRALHDGDLDVAADRVAEFVGEYLDHRLMPLIGEHGDDDDDVAARKTSLQRTLEDEPSRLSTYARLLVGGTRYDTRRMIQAAFNRAQAWPRILIAQSQVGREGLNLHHQCRIVLQFHAEWNPAVLEQQIGRVDRKDSLWEQQAKRWLESGANPATAPRIEVRRLVFAGTYDAFKWSRVGRRQHDFDASLFGSLLPEEAWERVPPDRIGALIDAAPRFDPQGRRPLIA